MQVQRLADPGIAGREGIGMPVHDEPDVADEALIQDGMDGLTIIGGPLRQPPEPGPLGGLVHRALHRSYVLEHFSLHLER
jgi:hypothetical protein